MPYHDTGFYDLGGPHNQAASEMDVNGGRMDGFVESFRTLGGAGCIRKPVQKKCRFSELGPGGTPDVMGYHTRPGDPELLGIRGAVSAAGPHVRPERLVDAAGAPLPGLGLVGAVLGSGRT